MLRNITLTTSASVLLLLGGLSAQQPTSYFIPDSNASAGTCNVIPFGHTSASVSTWGNQIYHTLVLDTDLAKRTGVICDLGFVPCVTSIRTFKTIEIKMDYFQGTGTTMSTTYSQNISSNAVTVLSATDYAWHVTANQWNRIGLQRPFLYVASKGHLLIQIKVTGAVAIQNSTSFPGFRTGSRQRVYSYGSQWVGGKPPAVGRTSRTAAQKIEVVFNGADLGKFGQSCAGSNSKSPALNLTGSAALGKTVTIALTDALPSTPMFVVVGLNQLPNPFDLGQAGAPGCRLYISNDILFIAAADRSGAYSLRLPVPNNAGLICQKVHSQILPFDAKANAFGATASNYGRIMVGN